MSTIFHIDVNSAFLSWSALKKLKEEPGSVDLRTIPSAVGGDVESRRGVITAKSIPAKKYGVQTGEPVMRALQKCPGLVLVKSDFETYRAYSHAFLDILRSYTPLVEQLSIDEAYLDVTALKETFVPGPGEEPYPVGLAQHIKNQIRDELGFTVNVGVSENRLLAKMASDFSKPDKVHTLFPSEVPEKMWPLPIGDLYGCGHATASRLETMGLHTIGDVAKTDLSILKGALGEKSGLYIHRSANGISRSEINPEQEDAKGYSNETTTPFDITAENYEKETPQILEKLSQSVARRMQRDGVFASTIGVMVKTDTFKRHSRQTTLTASTNDADVINSTVSALLSELLQGEDGLFAKGFGIRLIGVSGTNLDKGEYRQMDIFEAMARAEEVSRENAAREEKNKLLREMEKELAEKFGEDVIRRGL